MKAEEAGADLERLRALFAAERSANFPEFTDVYCVDAADDVLARFARARRGDPEAALAFLREDYEWRKAEDAVALRSTPPADVLGHDPAVLAEYYRTRSTEETPTRSSCTRSCDSASSWRSAFCRWRR